MLLGIAGFLVFSAVFTYLRIRRAITYSGGILRYGKPGVWGYVQTAVKWVFNAEEMIREGRRQARGQAFALPTPGGLLFFLPPKYLERVRSSNDDVYSQILAVNENLQLPYTMDPHQLHNPYQAKAMRTDVTRVLSSMIPDLLDESILAVEDTFKLPPNQGSLSFPVFETMTHLVARISNRVMFGPELCRDKKFIHHVVRFAETIPVIAPFISWTPQILRGLVYFTLSNIMGGKKEPLRFIEPWLQRYWRQREETGVKENLIVEHLIQNAPEEESLRGLAIRCLNLNFGSIHTSSIFISQTLFEIAILPEKDVESMRAEIRDALESEGGWTKAALHKCRKVDSALREVGRRYGLMFAALPRITVVQCDLDDGTYLAPGSSVCLDMTAIHFDPEIYPDPMRCDLFRFSKLRAQDDADTKYGFATIDSNYLPFGAGRHACAGRWFAAMELKLLLSHMLLSYDIKLPDGITERPKTVTFNGGTFPDPSAKLVFKPRKGEKLY